MNKIIPERGKLLTNTAKLVAVMIAISFNVFYLFYNKQIASFDEQKSILLLCGFVAGIFLPIDISLLVSNITGGRH